MADNDRWRNDQQPYGYNDDDYGRNRRYRVGRGSSGRGEMYRGSDLSGSEDTGGYGAERYSRSYPDYARGTEGYGGNDYGGGFYGADQGYRGPHQDVWGYRGERGGWDRFSDELSSWAGDEDAERRRMEDAHLGDRGAQHHRGRGPRGYTRPDSRILEDVSDRLTDDPLVDASEIEVTVENHEVVLSGMVDHREAKRRAEDIAERVSGVTHVQNNLRVRPEGHGTAAGTEDTLRGRSTIGPQGTGLGGVEVGPRGSETARGRGGGRKTKTTA